MLDPKDIFVNGRQLSIILEAHKRFILDQDGGERADLRYADLRYADLRDANLRYANLRNADLRNADLRDAKNNELAAALVSIIPEGEIVGWKQAKTISGKAGIIMLKIPVDARRSNATGRKCRAEFADDVKHFVDGKETMEDLYSTYNKNFCYTVGARITPDKWDENRWDECSNGVHFFITRIEAEQY